MTRGDVRVGSTLLAIGDGMACTEMGDFAITAADGGAEVLPFDLL